MSKVIIPSRQEAREEVAKLLEGSTSTSVAEIYPYQNDDLNGQSPVIRIFGASAERPRLTFKGVGSTFRLTIQNLVLYTEENTTLEGREDTVTGTLWNPRLAENKLDELEKYVAQSLLVAEFPKEHKIRSIEQEGPSTVRKDDIQGQIYLIEFITIKVEMRYGIEE